MLAKASPLPSCMCPVGSFRRVVKEGSPGTSGRLALVALVQEAKRATSCLSFDDLSHQILTQ